MAVQHQMHAGQKKNVMGKEVIVGFLAIALGAFNLATQFGWISINIQIPQMIANIILVIAGLILWASAYKLWRYRWHSSRIF